MGLIDSVRRFFTRGSGFVVSSHSLYNTDNPTNYTSWAYTCIDLIANRLAGAIYHLEDKSGKQIKHDYQAFLKKKLMKQMGISLYLYGEASVLKIQGANKKILGLEFVRKDSIYPLRKQTGELVWRIGQKEFPQDAVMHFTMPSPFNTFGEVETGHSPYMAAKQTIDAEANKEAWNKALIDNGAVPGLILEVDGSMDPNDIQRLQEQVNSKYGNVKNKSKTMVLTNGMKANKDFILTQKDMDFIEGIKWDMDKILAIFKVPKAMLGMAEQVNVGNVAAFEGVFARNVMEPLCMFIAEELTEELFNNEAIVFFDNIIPRDEEQIRNNYFAGGITRNEMRMALGYDAVEGGDVFIDGSEAKVNVPSKDKTIKEAIEKGIQKGIKETEKRSEEHTEKRWEEGVKRQESFEQILERNLKRIFDQQEDYIMKQLEDKKNVKSTVKLGNRYRNLYISLLVNPLLNFMKEEGQIAMDEVTSGVTFSVAAAEKRKIAREQITQLAEQVDSVTDEKISAIITASVSQGLTTEEVKEAIGEVFVDLKESRLATIVRTESVRGATEGQIQAWKDSDVVKGKQRWCALDERTCQYCGVMHGKIVELETNFFDKGNAMMGSRGGILRLDYSDTTGPGLHPNCRCTLIPVLKDASELF